MTALLFKSFPVTGVEDSDGDLKVVGRCSDGELDHDGDIVSPAWMAAAVKEFMGSYPAVRLQHRPDYPVGRGLEAWQDGTGATWLKALIVDPLAVKLAKASVLAAWSIGIAEPLTRKSAKARRFEIYGGRLAEVSLVDSPSNARCGVTVTKGNQYVGKAFGVAKGKKSRIFEEHYQELAGLACGCQQCLAVTRSMTKAADPVRTAEKAFRQSMRSGLNSSDPWIREAARGVLSRGQD